MCELARMRLLLASTARRTLAARLRRLACQPAFPPCATRSKPEGYGSTEGASDVRGSSRKRARGGRRRALVPPVSRIHS